MNPFIVISGCSGGGKSTLLAELQARGYAVVTEPGRRIIQAQSDATSQALPWVDMSAFLQQALLCAMQDYRSALENQSGWTFFDRSLIDAAAALQALTGNPLLAELAPQYRYHPQVFLTPPWPEIYTPDEDRRHSFEDAIAEYERLQQTYPALGYRVALIPKLSVAQRADFILDTLAAT